MHRPRDSPHGCPIASAVGARYCAGVLSIAKQRIRSDDLRSRNSLATVPCATIAPPPINGWATLGPYLFDGDQGLLIGACPTSLFWLPRVPTHGRWNGLGSRW